MSNITPCLWFNKDGEEAARFYAGLFPNSKIGRIARYPESMMGYQAGEVLTVEFELDGKPFLALNGGPQFPFTEAVSFQVFVKDQAELDRYWTGLLAGGGKESQCGWLKDRFGLSWQIVPEQMADWMAGANGAAVFQAMMPMVKLDFAALEAAAKG